MSDSEILTLENVAEYLHVHQSTVYRLLKKKQIHGFKVGRDWRFTRASLEAWTKAQESLQS